MKVHPYAEQWRLLEGEAFDALCEDIAANGLNEAIVTFHGQIADGRNRHAACEKAGVDPHFREFEGDDDDLLAFIESANAHRRHDSPGQIAVSRALMWIEAGRRREGRWVGWSRTSQEIGKSSGEVEAMRRAGVIADHAPDLLVAVRDDEMSLNAAHGKAEQARDAVRQRHRGQQSPPGPLLPAVPFD